VWIFIQGSSLLAPDEEIAKLARHFSNLDTIACRIWIFPPRRTNAMIFDLIKQRYPRCQMRASHSWSQNSYCNNWSFRSITANNRARNFSNIDAGFQFSHSTAPAELMSRSSIQSSRATHDVSWGQLIIETEIVIVTTEVSGASISTNLLIRPGGESQSGT
jgi:hypothetical protein